MSLFTKKSQNLNSAGFRQAPQTLDFRLNPVKLFSGIKSSLSSNYSQDSVIKTPVVIGGLAVLISTLILALTFNRLPPEVPFYYSQPWGETRLAVRYNLWFLPAISLGLLGLNVIFGKAIYRSDPLLAKVLVWAGGGVAVFISIGLVQIIRLVSS